MHPRKFMFHRLLTVILLILLSFSALCASQSSHEAKEVSFAVDVFRVEKKPKYPFTDWYAVFSSDSLRASLPLLVQGRYPNSTEDSSAIFDGKLAGSSAFLQALSEKARVTVIARLGFETMKGVAVPIQMGTTSEDKKHAIPAFDMVMLPSLLPDDRIQLQFSINVFDKGGRRTFDRQQEEMKSAQTLVLSEVAQKDGSLLLILITPTLKKNTAV